ncbi:MAG: hypothetical protein HY329_18180, partial [Chloroflexi bacterium]|nr:hypothetical protein [Chloroflexota bacterium]
ADETFYVNLSNASAGTITRPQALGTITDDDASPTLSINDVTVAEGSSGTTNAVFTVTLSATSGQTVTVKYATAAGDTNPANSGSSCNGNNDYLTISSTALTFSPGTTTQTITATVCADTTNENDETFKIVLSGATNATLADNTGVATIANDDVSISINSPSVTESSGGVTSTAGFTVTLAQTSSLTVTVNYATSNGTTNPATGGSDCNTSGVDYLTQSNGTVTFSPGTTNQTISVTICGDNLSEANETFKVTLSSPSNGQLGTSVGTATITDDDTQPTLAINSVSVVEGNSGSTNAVFTVTLSGQSGQTVTVDYATAEGGTNAAASGNNCTNKDFQSTSGSLTFSTGETTKTISVPICGDTDTENDETFRVNLSNASGATITTSQGTGTILDDDGTLSINNAQVTEGDASSTNAVFTVTLSKTPPAQVTVSYATGGGTATAGGSCGSVDYITTTGTLTFTANTTSLTQTISVPVCGDTAIESNETFNLTLSSASGAQLGTSQGTGTITDDDTPTISIDDVSVVEGDTGTTNAAFTVTLSRAHTSQAVTVDYTTAAGTADQGNSSCSGNKDYIKSQGTLTFPQSTTTLTQTITVQICGDTIGEGDETFFVDLSSASGANITDNQGLGTITDNGDVQLSITDVTLVEGKAPGTKDFVFTVTASTTSTVNVSYRYETANGTATGGASCTTGVDYISISQTNTTFAANTTELTQSITVTVCSDNVVEPNETFYLDLSLPPNPKAVISQSRGTGTITDDDTVPTLSINNVQTVESNSGTPSAVFTVTQSNIYQEFVTANYATANGSNNGAKGGASCIVSSSNNDNIDYLTTSGSLTFASGTTSLTQTITVSICGETLKESDETYTVDLTGITNATATTAQGTGTILDDDTQPSLSITSSVGVTEGNSGSTTNAVFTVTLSAGSGQVVTVNYATGGAATAGSACGGLVDYIAQTGQLTFNTGDTTKTISVVVCGDTDFETSETFTVTLSNASNATIIAAVGTGTIGNDDTQSVEVPSGPSTPTGCSVVGYTMTLCPGNPVAALNTDAVTWTIMVPANVTNAQIDASALLTTTGGPTVATLRSDIVIQSTTSLGQIQVNIWNPNTISTPGAWNGSITTPIITRNDAEGATIEIGFGSTPLTFEHPVRLLFSGMAGRLPGYISGGQFKTINTTCQQDSFQWADTNLPAGGDCATNTNNGSGPDLVIWTKHFTEFALLTGRGSGGSGGGDTGNDRLPVAPPSPAPAPGGGTTTRGVTPLVNPAAGTPVITTQAATAVAGIPAPNFATGGLLQVIPAQPGSVAVLTTDPNSPSYVTVLAPARTVATALRLQPLTVADLTVKPGAGTAAVTAVSVDFYDARTGTALTRYDAPVTLATKVTPEALAGVANDAKRLALVRYDAATTLWFRLPATFDPGTKVLQTQTLLTGTFAVVQLPPELAEVVVTQALPLAPVNSLPTRLANLPYVARNANGWNTDLQIQSLSATADVTIVYYDLTGQIAGQQVERIDAGASRTLLRSALNVPDAFEGSAVVRSSHPVAVTVNLTSEAPVRSASYGSVGVPSKTQYVPLLLRENGGWSSELYVQNATRTGRAASVYVELYQGSTMVRRHALGLVPAGATAHVNLNDVEMLGPGWVGSAKVVGDEPVAVLINNAHAQMLSSYTGFAAGVSRVSLPLVMNDNAGWTTGIQVQNVGGTASTARLRINGKVVAEVQLGPGGSQSWFPVPGTEAGFVGAATIEAAAGSELVAIINQVHPESGQATAYRGFGGGSGALSAPLIMTDNAGWTSGLQVQNAGAQATVVSIYIAGVKVDTIQLAPGESKTWFPIPGTEAGFVGAITAQGDPIAQLVGLVNIIYRGDGQTGDNTLSYEATNH